MAVYVSNIVIDVGTDFFQTFTLESYNNTPLDLTLYSGTSILKKSPLSKSVAATFEVSFPNRESGQVKIALGSSQTNSLRPGRYSYDVLLDDGNQKIRVVEGSALVTAGVTTS